MIVGVISVGVMTVRVLSVGVMALSPKFNHISGVMVSVFVSSAVDSRVRAPVGSNQRL
jgi:hypothetical protein